MKTKSYRMEINVWDISKRREDGAYRIAAHAATLPEARKLVIGKGDQK